VACRFSEYEGAYSCGYSSGFAPDSLFIAQTDMVEYKPKCGANVDIFLNREMKMEFLFK